MTSKKSIACTIQLIVAVFLGTAGSASGQEQRLGSVPGSSVRQPVSDTAPDTGGNSPVVSEVTKPEPEVPSSSLPSVDAAAAPAAFTTPQQPAVAAPSDVNRTATSGGPSAAPAARISLDRVPAVDDKAAPKAATASVIPSSWHFGGYGELLLTTSFYHPDLKTNDTRYRDTQLDLARFSLFVGNDITKRISFSSEIEFEHGGTGVAREIEWEEFGEYETEVEKGGEIVLEQAFLEGRPTDWLALRAGHLLVPVGMTTQYHMPTLFSSARRPESEAQILPNIWHENGVEAQVRAYDFTLRAQVLTGLDSTGFSSNRWIAGGTQHAFERPLINDFATVLAVDYLGIQNTVIGASVYSSGSNRNRPKRDLYETGGRVTLGDLHVRFQQGPLKLRGLVLLGHLQNASAITRANASLSSDLGASRTAVASAAYAAWLEAAYDVLSVFVSNTRQRLDTFARFDAYDSMWHAGADFDNPLLQRRAVTTGLNYFPHPRVVVKAEYVSRWLNENRHWDRHQSELNAGLGFVL
jgi:hypothetical protein